MTLPVILNKPARMTKVSIVVSKDDRERTFKILQKAGLIHITEREKKIIDYIKVLENIKHCLDKIESILRYARGRVIDVKITLSDILETKLSEIINDVEMIYERIRFLEDSLRRFREKKKSLKHLYTILNLLPKNIPVEYISFSGKYVSSKLIYAPLTAIEEFTRKTKIFIKYKATYKDHGVLIVVYPSSFEKEITRNLNLLNITIVDVPRSYLQKYRRVGDLVSALNSELRELDEKIRSTQEELKNFIEKVINDLIKYKIILENVQEKIIALANSLPSKYLTIIEGWVPEKYVDKLKEVLEENNIKYYMEIRKPSDIEEPPTLLDNPPVINYYEPIVKFLGVPRYNEWDPTPIIAYSFAFFYGLMIGDIGYSIALILITLLLLDRLAGYIESPDYVKFKKSFIVSNIIGLAIGLMTGTFLGDISDRFGFREIFSSIFHGVSKLFTDPLMFLASSIIIGLIHVNIAHAIALAKYIKNKSIGEVLNELGLFISEAFGIPYILYKMLDIRLPFINNANAMLFLYGALVGVALIIIGAIKCMGGLGLLMWIFNLTGLLGDVLSYSRLAGVGLATIYLASSFNTMASMAYSALLSMFNENIAGVIIGGIVALLIAGFGHLINTALSAIGAFIHSLRLCFVEFLTKFYEGTGYAFEPLRIVVRRKIVIE